MLPAVPAPRIRSCFFIWRVVVTCCNYMRVCEYASVIPILKFMNLHPTSDARGVIIPCPACETANRIPFAQLGQVGRCGSCKAPLQLLAAPVEVGELADFAQLIQNSPLPVLVDFWAPWCGPCRMMAPEFEKVAAMSAGKLVLAKVNTEEQQSIAAQFRISSIPAFALFHRGKEQGRTAGFQPAAQLIRWANQVLG